MRDLPMKQPRRRSAFALAMSVALMTGTAQGQASAPSDPSDATASVSKAVYESAFQGYERLSVQPVESWRSVNDEVNRVGGWRTYAREIQAGSNSGTKGRAPQTQPTGPDSKPAEHKH